MERRMLRMKTEKRTVECDEILKILEKCKKRGDFTLEKCKKMVIFALEKCRKKC